MESPEELFVRFRQHADAPALAAVFDAVAPELLLVASHLATAPTGAEDLVQATFLDAIEKADRWDAARSLMPWLIGILVNHARLERRRQQRPLDAARLPQPAEPSPLDAVAASEVAEQVAGALRSLPRQFRQTLTLRVVHGLTPTEIAHALGCPVATVKTRLQRGLDWLRKLLPSGIAVGLAGMLTTGRGLAAVRGAVLAKAKILVPVAAVAAIGVIGGGVVMKKLVLAACVILCIAVLWMVVPRPDEAVIAGGAVPVPSGSAQATMLVAASTDTAPNGPVAGERVAVPVSTAATGSADLEFVWKGYDSPAAHLQFWWRLHKDYSEGSMHRCYSDAKGRLRLPDLRAAEYELRVDDFRARPLTIRAGQETRERIEVEPRWRVNGMVVDAEGHGIGGATVYIRNFGQSEDLEPRRVATTRDNGTFDGPADRDGSFWARKPGFAPSDSQPIVYPGGRLQYSEMQRQHVRLVLEAAGTAVQGTVITVDGQPAANARVTIVRTSPRNQCAGPIVLCTDAKGRFATTELSPGEHLLLAQAPGHAATPVPLAVTAGQEQTLAVQLGRGATVFGSVRTADGERIRAMLEVRLSLPGAQSGLIPSLQPLIHLCERRVFCDVDGNFRIDAVPGGSVSLQVRTRTTGAAGGPSRHLQLQEGELRRCDFVLVSGGEIRGRVVDGHDQPLADWHVFASQTPGGVDRDATTDAHGAFALGGLLGTEYSVTARDMDSYLPWVSASSVPPGAGELVLRVQYTTEDAGWFTGTILDATGAPATTITAFVTPVGHVRCMERGLRLRDGGTFELGPVPPGNYDVVVSVADQGRMSLGRHALAPRAKVDLGTAQLPSAGILELRFSTPDGRAVAPDELSVWDKAGNGGAVFERGTDGIFRSKPLPAGTYRVFAWGEDFARLDQPAVVTAERATLTELQVAPATTVRFVLPRPAAASGSEHWSAQVQLQVMDAAGKVVASPMLSIDTADEFTWSRGLPRGNYSFEAKVPPDGEPVRGTFAVSGEAGVQRVEVKLPAKGN